MSKKYYWLKLKEDFFRQKEIKKLRKIAGGDTYTIIYLKMQLLSLQNEGVLKYEGVEENIAEQIALEIDEDVDNVQITLSFLMANKLIEEISKTDFFLVKANDCIGKEVDSAARVRAYRERKKQEEKRIEEEKNKQEQGLLESPKKEQEPYSNAKRQRMFRAKKNCEEKQHIPFIEDYMNKKRYNGNYYIVLQRDKFRCALCNSIENLCVHHIDGYDESKPENNNENKMVTLCRHCHSNVHAGTKINEDILNSIDYYTEYSNVTLPGNGEVTDSNNTVTKSNTEKEIDIDIEKEIDIDKDTINSISSTEVQQIIDTWNSLGLQNIKFIKNNTNRYKMLNARIKEYGIDTFLQAINNIRNSSFLKGQNNRNWIITFDWLIKPNNFIKVLEGNYDDKENKGGFNNESRSNTSKNNEPSKGKSEEHDAKYWEEQDRILNEGIDF